MAKIVKSNYVNLNKDETVSINNQYLLSEFYRNSAKESETENLETLISAELKNEQLNQIFEEAKIKAEREAEAIKMKVFEEIETQRQEIFNKSKEEGYESGLAEAEEKIQKKQRELDEKIQENLELRDKTLMELEKEIVQFVVDLTQNVLTKSFEINPQIISFLVRKGLTQVKNFENLKIYVSENQYEFVEENKNSILGIDTENYKIQIVKDTTLKDYDCLIETDFGTINCSCLEQFEGIKNTLDYIID